MGGGRCIGGLTLVYVFGVGRGGKKNKGGGGLKLHFFNGKGCMKKGRGVPKKNGGGEIVFRDSHLGLGGRLMNLVLGVGVF